jgi:hypothetical protein
MSAARRLRAVPRIAWEHPVVLITLLGGAIRFATLGTQGFWFDESLTVVDIREGPLGVLDPIRAGETTPPVYFMLAGAWKGIFGDGEVGLRSLSALLGTATIPVMYAAGRELASRRAGIAAAAIAAASPLMIWYSQEARSYALFGFMSALSFLFFAGLLRDRGPLWLWAWALSSALALSTHYFAIALVIPEAAWLLWRRQDRRWEVAFGTALVGLVGVALLPLAHAQQKHAGWIPIIDRSDRVFQVPEHFVVGMESPWNSLPIAAVIAVVIAVAWGIARATGVERRTFALCAGLAAIGGLATVLAAYAGDDYVISRNLLASWIPFAVAVGIALTVPALGWRGPIAVSLLCAVGVALGIWTAVTPAAGRPDWQALTTELGTPAHRRVVFSNSAVNLPLTLKLPGATQVPVGHRVSTREVDVVSLRRVPDYAVGPCWWISFCGGKSPFGPGDWPRVPATFRLEHEGSTYLFHYRRYTAPGPVRLPPAGFADVLVQPRPG